MTYEARRDAYLTHIMQCFECHLHGVTEECHCPLLPPHWYKTYLMVNPCREALTFANEII